jgi:BASS family bile acid:Na+ symporter
MLERFLIVWLAGLSLAAYLWPQLTQALPPRLAVGDPFSASVPYLNYLIAATMFAIGWMLPRDEVRQLGERWHSVLSGTTVQYLAMPSLAWLMGRMLGLEGDRLVGLVLVGCVPGAMASNVLTLIARGNTTYSVCLTTLATLLSPLATPLAMRLTLATESSVDPDVFWQAARTLLFTVVAPVLAGYGLSRLAPKWEQPARRIGAVVANLAILWVIAAVVGHNRQKVAGIDGPLLGALVGVNFGGYLAGYFAALLMRMPEPMRRTLTLEVGMQNAGLGAMLATQLFPGRPEAAIAPALYAFGCMLTGTFLARIWAARGESVRGTA